MIDKKVKEKWVKALRSGEYKRGTGRLKIADSRRYGTFEHCCLGVLCEIDPRVEALAPDQFGIVVYQMKGRDKLSKNASQLPSEYRRLIGLREQEQLQLIRMNDGGQSFEHIADWIEQNL